MKGKYLYILLAAAALLTVILVVVYYRTAGLSLLPEEPQESRSIEELQETFNVIEPSPSLRLASPVESKYWEALADAPDSDHLTFFLPTGVRIYPLFSGRVERITSSFSAEGEKEFDDVMIKSVDGKILSSYLVNGAVLVEEGDEVAESTIIVLAGKSNRDEGSIGIGALGGGNLGVWLHSQEKEILGDVIKLSLEMFRSR